MHHPSRWPIRSLLFTVDIKGYYLVPVTNMVVISHSSAYKIATPFKNIAFLYLRTPHLGCQHTCAIGFSFLLLFLFLFFCFLLFFLSPTQQNKATSEGEGTDKTEYKRDCKFYLRSSSFCGCKLLHCRILVKSNSSYLLKVGKLLLLLQGYLTPHKWL